MDATFRCHLPTLIVAGRSYYAVAGDLRNPLACSWIFNPSNPLTFSWRVLL